MLNVPLVIPFQEPTAPLTREAALTEALRSHPRVEVLRRELAARFHAVKAARALTAPSITLAPGLTSFSGTTEELLALQPLELNGTRTARGAVALAEFRSAQADAQRTLLSLAHEVHLAVIVVDRARGHVVLTETQLRQAQALEQLAQKQVELGTRPGIDLETLALETLRVENLRTKTRSEVKNAEMALNLLLGRPADSVVPRLAPLPLPLSVGPIETLLSSALALRPELKQVAAEKEVTQARQKLLQAEGKPDLAPLVRVGNLFRGTPSGNTGNGAGIGVALSLPLDHGGRRAQKAGLQARLDANQSHHEDLARQIEREVREAAETLSTAQTLLQRFEGQALPRVERLLRASRIGFEEGKTSVLAVIEAQRTYRQLQSDTLQARTEVLLALAALDKARGVSLIPLPEVAR